MKREIASYIAAFISAGFHAAAVYYLNIVGVEATNVGMRYTDFALSLLAAAVIFLLAEYIFFGRKDSWAEIAVRFAVHNVMSAVWAFGLYGIYSFAYTREKHDFSPQIIMKIVTPSCISGFLKFSAAAAAVCIVIRIARIFKETDS